MARYRDKIICPNCKGEAVSLERGIPEQISPNNNPNTQSCMHCEAIINVSVAFKTELKCEDDC
jgi:hypothetical protein